MKDVSHEVSESVLHQRGKDRRQRRTYTAVIVDRGEKGDVLVRPNNDDTTNLRIDTVVFVSLSVSVVIACFVGKTTSSDLSET